MKRLSGYWKGILILSAASACLAGLSFIPAFCDWYILAIYKPVSSFWGRLTAKLPFLLGEILMYIAALLFLIMLICSLLRIFLRKKQGYKAFYKSYAKGFLALVLVAIFLYLAMWLLPYRTSELTFGKSPDKKYTTEDLLELTIATTEKLNSISAQIERDAEKHVVVPDDTLEALHSGMCSLSEEFPLYGGYYVPAKYALCSDFLEWMGIGGFTFPYSMELCMNYYGQPNALYHYCLLAHEEAHHLGYYRENEGTFFGILSCIRSDSLLLQYNGYLEAHYYLMDALLSDNIDGIISDFYFESIYPQIALSQQVKADRQYFLRLRNELYEANVNQAMESTFKETSESIAEVCWETQGEILGESSYDGVVLLLLRYFDKE